MGKKWRKSIGVFSIRFLQISILVGIFIFIEQLILGYIAAPDIVDIFALLLIFLLGLGVLALNWLIFEINRIDKE